MIMPRDVDYPVFISRNQDVADVSLLSLHGKNNEKSLKQDIVANISFEVIFTLTKNYFFHHHMVGFFNKLYFNDQEYQTDGTVRDESYKGKFLFTMKYFV